MSYLDSFCAAFGSIIQAQFFQYSSKRKCAYVSCSIIFLINVVIVALRNLHINIWKACTGYVFAWDIYIHIYVGERTTDYVVCTIVSPQLQKLQINMLQNI